MQVSQGTDAEALAAESGYTLTMCKSSTVAVPVVEATPAEAPAPVVEAPVETPAPAAKKVPGPASRSPA